MAFDFLDSQGQPQPSGGKIDIGTNVFYDQYTSHFDAHKLISNPPKRNEFKLKHNFDIASDRVFDVSSVKSLIRDGFFGDNTDYEKLINGYTIFQDPKLLEQTIKKIDAEISVDLFSGLKKPKMNINDRFGIFSFDLASMAMNYIYEYFDKKGNQVDANFIYKIKDKFYEINSKKEVFQKIKKRENGTPVVVSSVRKCMIDFEKKEQKERAVEIFINASFIAKDKANEIVYNPMAGISVAQNLILKGFRVKLTYIKVVELNKKTYFHFVPLKRYDQPLDVNAVAYVCGDARFARYQGFKLSIWGFDQDGAKTPGGLGSPVRDMQTISKAIEDDYVPNSDLVQADTRLYFGGSRNLNQAKSEVDQALKILNSKYSEDED